MPRNRSAPPRRRDLARRGMKARPLWKIGAGAGHRRSRRENDGERLQRGCASGRTVSHTAGGREARRRDRIYSFDGMDST